MTDYAMFDADFEECLASRVLLYRLFQSLTGTEPRKDNLDILFSDLFKESYALCVPAGTDETLRALSVFSAHLSSDPEVVLDKLKDEYTRLFLGPNKLIAPPWESSYYNDEHQLFRETTLAVRKAYVEASFLPAEYQRVPDDHLSLELGFMAELARQLYQYAIDGDRASFNGVARTSLTFLTDHLLTWVPRYVADLGSATGTGFYPCVAHLMGTFLEEDARMFSRFA